MKSTISLVLLSALSTHFQTTSAFWRLACSVAQTARIDPVLAPNEISPHTHKISGAQNINQYSTYDTLQETNCTTCEVQADHSGYWTPQLYYAHSNGSFQDVRNVGMTVYYVGRGGNSSNTVPFPPGFKMLSGNSTVRSYDNDTLTYMNTRPIADRVSFHCIDENNDIAEQHYMFDTNCVNGMRAQVNFQSCWDGVNLYMEDQSHVAYLSGIDNGVCPPTHPVSIPGLFFEVLYFTNEIDQSAGGTFTFAQGDATGYGFHGDFINGWDMTVQTNAVQSCLYETASQGVVSACPYLAPTDDTNVPRDCLPAAPLNDEPVLGLLTQLPGCNNVTFGPDPAPQIVCPLDSNTPVTTQVVNSATTGYMVATSTVSLDYTTVTVTAGSETASLTLAVESSTSTESPTASTTYSQAATPTSDFDTFTPTSSIPSATSSDTADAVTTTDSLGNTYTYTVYSTVSADYTSTSSYSYSTTDVTDPVTTTDQYGNTYTYTPSPTDSNVYTSTSSSAYSTSDATDPATSTSSTDPTDPASAGVFIAESTTVTISSTDPNPTDPASSSAPQALVTTFVTVALPSTATNPFNASAAPNATGYYYSAPYSYSSSYSYQSTYPTDSYSYSYSYVAPTSPYTESATGTETYSPAPTTESSLVYAFTYTASDPSETVTVTYGGAGAQRRGRMEIKRR